MVRKRFILEFSGVLSLTVLGFLTMGYHPGIEDDGLYLAAVKADLHPALFPFNAQFFRLQMEATVFDGWMAAFVRWTQIPVAWAELLWQFAALFLILWAVKKIAGHLFADAPARWAAAAMVAAMFTLPVTGTALYMADQHLHPRNLATALILLAVSRILIRRFWQAVPLLLAAFLLHPLMAALGISFCCFLLLSMHDPVWNRLNGWQEATAAVIPIGWVFDAGNPAWRQAMNTRTYLYVYRWQWYEWVGVLAPLAFFGLLWRVAGSRKELPLARFSAAVFFYGIFHQLLAMILLSPAAPARLASFQPMRYLHLIYFLMMLVAGGLLGRYVFKCKILHWAVFLLAVNLGMLAWQKAEFAASRHLEMPWSAPTNPWLQAFEWIRQNTPGNAYFALDPHYLEAPGEDFHGFRALAERSQLADAVKDTAVVTQIPELGPIWAKQLAAEAGWSRFQLADFERLKATFGVDWVLLSDPPPAGLNCHWHNGRLTVCQIP